MIRVVILSADTHYLTETTNYLAARRGISIIGTATDGRHALRLIRREQPDLVVLSLVLLGMDGLTLMRELQRLTSPPLVIVYTAMYNATTLKLAYKYGASYFFCRPLEMRCLYSAIVDQYQCLGRQTAPDERISVHQGSAQISRLLESCGISRHLGGSRYLAEALSIVSLSPASLHNLTRNVYTRIAERFHTSVSCVERNIRTAIGSAYNSGSLSGKYAVCPSNREFIRTMSERIPVLTPADDEYSEEL